MSKRTTGNEGERLAEDYLKKKGYKIIDRNFYIRGGEIDLIAWEGKTLVFVEVKLRRGNSFGSAVESVGYFKLKALKRSVQVYLQARGLEGALVRVDLVAIDENAKGIKIEHIKNILEEEYKG